MEQVRRTSGRVVRPRLDPAFVYDSASVQFLQRREIRVNIQPQASTPDIGPEINAGKDNSVSGPWSDLYFPLVNICEQINEQPSAEIRDLAWRSSPVIQPINSEDEEEFVVNGNVNKTDVRRISSTRLDYLDNCLSVSSNYISDSSIMGLSDDERQGDIECVNKGQACSCDKCAGADAAVPQGRSRSAKPSEDLNVSDALTLNTVLDALGKIDVLTNEMTSLRNLIVQQNQAIGSQHMLIGRQNSRISRLEVAQSSGHESSQSSQKSVSTGSKKKSNSSSKIKKNIVEKEKVRTYKVVKNRIEDSSSSSSSSSDSSSEPSSDNSESSAEESVNQKSMRKKMTKKQKAKCKSRVGSVLSKSGSTFPKDEFESTDSSGKESCDLVRSCKHSNKVKSGAKIKKRPVVRTELWPHTVANEEDGDELDSETISCSKFFEYFGFIASTCKSKSESRGRAALLQAIGTVLGCLQWAEARAFHNLVLLKIEQGRIGWDENFAAMADTFIKKKLRTAMRTRRTAGSNAARSYSQGRGAGNGFRGQNQRQSSGRGRPLYGAICWQWNTGSCSYGENCKRWHVCKSCAEAGKLGEKHKASSHGGAGTGQAGQQV